ncbi:MAG: hypothetical protein ACJA0U_001242 [Salibacteraceae bacterium]
MKEAPETVLACEKREPATNTVIICRIELFITMILVIEYKA